jgi:hypothetical protein
LESEVDLMLADIIISNDRWPISEPPCA